VHGGKDSFYDTKGPTFFFEIGTNAHNYECLSQLKSILMNLIFAERDALRDPATPFLTRVAQTPTLEHMDVRLTPDQQAFIARAIESGRFTRAEDAIEEALSLWEERERRRVEILAAVDAADASLARGEGRILTQESMWEFAERVKQRGRARLSAEQQEPR
jgi:putative addiction module CopG family antidote